MCGIGGIISKTALKKVQRVFFQDLMKSLQSRGRDAFGYTTYPTNTTLKSVGDVDEFLKSGRRTIHDKIKGSFSVLGHTRAKTRGNEKHNYNNHPFTTKDFVLAHNGTIRNDDKIKDYFKINTKIETDSYVIIRLIQHFYNKTNDVPKAIEEARNRLDGGYACWLLHRATGDVYLFKGNYSSLSVAYLRPWDCFIFASAIDNFKDLIEKSFNKSNEECGLFNTNIVIRKLDDDKIYKINLKNAKVKRDRTCIYGYNEKKVVLPDVKSKTIIYGKNQIDDDSNDDDTINYNSDHDAFGNQRNFKKHRNNKRRVKPKETTNNSHIDKELRTLRGFGLTSEIYDGRVKIFLPDNDKFKTILHKNGYTLGKDRDRLKIKIRNQVLAITGLRKIGVLAMRHCNELPMTNVVDGY